jgi:penicillin-binding protein 1A
VFQSLFKVIRICGFIFSVSLVTLGALFLYLYGEFRNDLPSIAELSHYKPNIKSKVYAENGELIAEFGVEKRILLPKGQIPKRVIQAFIASEDKHFYEHHGIDFKGITNAVLQSLSRKRSSLRGASTITQQLAKGLLIDKEGYEAATARTLARKIKEAILARRLEMYLHKDDILWMYLNEVYLGHGSYGVAAAAQNYFRKDVKNLSLSELAIIAGLPQAPSRFSPQSNRGAALARQAYVLQRMYDDGYISAREKKDALQANQDLVIYSLENSFRFVAPYFSEHVRRSLVEQYGEKTIYEEGLSIYTTLDIERERIMQRVLKEGLIEVDKRQGFLGPIFHPENTQEIKRARDIVDKINDKNLLNLGHDYELAQVKRLDHQNQEIIIENQLGQGVVTLSAMLWARKREPSENYEAHKLKHIGQVLSPGDIIMVKKIRTQDGVNLYSLEQEPQIEGAMIALEPQSGYVPALQGGYSFERSEFNRVFQACRQPGSLFKPIVYSAAISLKNYTPASILLDAPLTFRKSNNNAAWKPKNFDKSYKGEVTVREAVMRSMNIPTLNVMADVGSKNVIEWAEKLGIKTKLKMELGTAIGSSCVSPVEIAQVYSVFANLGQLIEPIFVKEIIDRDGKRLSFQGYQNDPWLKRSDRIDSFLSNYFQPKVAVMPEEDAYTMHYLMEESAKAGTAQRTRILNRTVAGKTGTTNDSFDTWFAGYSKNLLSIVWVGNDKMDKALGVYEQGGRTALPIFNNFFLEALKGVPDEKWEMPKSMCLARIDEKTGARIDYDHPLSFIAPFRCDRIPSVKLLPRESFDEALELLGGR